MTFVISENIAFEGFDAASWQALVSLFTRSGHAPVAAHADSTAAPPAPREVLVVVVGADAQPIAAVVPGRGSVAVTDLGPLDDLAAVAERARVGRVFVVEDSATDALVERTVGPGEANADYTIQWLVLLAAMRQVAREGTLRVWPEHPQPALAMLRRGLALALPDDHSLLAVVWAGEQVSTALAVRRSAGEIDRVIGPRTILEWAGPLSGDLQRDHRMLEQAVSDALAPVHLGVFAQRDVLTTLLRDADPGAWARAVALRDVVLRPAPAYAHAAVVADAMHGAARWTGRWLGNADLAGYVDPVARAGRSGLGRMSETLTGALGFDPLEAIARRFRGPER